MSGRAFSTNYVELVNAAGQRLTITVDDLGAAVIRYEADNAHERAEWLLTAEQRHAVETLSAELSW